MCGVLCAIQRSVWNRETPPIDFARFYFQITGTGNPGGNSGHFSHRRAVIQTGSRVSASYLSRSFPIRNARICPAISRRVFASSYTREYTGNFRYSKLFARKSYRYTVTPVRTRGEIVHEFRAMISPPRKIEVFISEIPDTPCSRSAWNSSIPEYDDSRTESYLFRIFISRRWRRCRKVSFPLLREHSRVSPCGWLFVERRHFLLTRGLHVPPAIRSCGIAYRIGDIDSHPDLGFALLSE